MKNFNQYVTEAGTGPVGNSPGTPLTVNDTDPFDLANPLVLKRVNAFVGSIADREYLMPESAIGQLRNFMMRLGIQFPKVDLPESGSVSLPLSQWGGRFGKDGNQAPDEVIDDDICLLPLVNFRNGDHTKKGVLQDWTDYSELVTKGGIVIFDDYWVGEYETSAWKKEDEDGVKWMDVVGAVNEIIDSKDFSENWENVGLFGDKKIIQRIK